MCEFDEVDLEGSVHRRSYDYGSRECSDLLGCDCHSLENDISDLVGSALFKSAVGSK